MAEKGRMSALSFDPIEHKYRDGSRRLFSTTEILRAVGLYSDYSFADAVHKYRGHAVHIGCSMIDAGGDPQLQRYPTEQLRKDIEEGYWVAFRRFKARTGFQGRIYECPFADPVSGFGGTFDVIGECGDELWMPDLKSGVLPELVPVQLASYADLIQRGKPINPDHPGLPWLMEAVKSGRPIKRKAVRLEKDGTDTLFSQTSKGISYDDPMWASAWRSALNCFILRSNYGLLERK